MGIDNKASPKATAREALVEMTRLNNLSDGVFAIALTCWHSISGCQKGFLLTIFPKGYLRLPQNSSFI